MTTAGRLYRYLPGCLGLLFCAGAAAAGPCPAEPGAGYRIEAAVEIPPPRLRHDLGRAELGELAFHGPSERVLGLTASSVEILVSTEAYSRTLGGGACVWLERIVATLRYDALDIFVAREYPPTSCPYQAILAHERRHAEITRRHLQAFVQPVRSALSALAIPRPESPLRAASAAAGEARIRDLLAGLLAPLRKELAASMNQAQARVDSREEYRRVRSQCRNW